MTQSGMTRSLHLHRYPFWRT